MSYAEKPADRSGLRRGTFLKMSAAGAAALAVGETGESVMPDLQKRGLFSANGVFDAASTALADLIYIEAFPTSPLILTPFSDPLPIPKALRAGAERRVYSTWAQPARARAPASRTRCGNERHQIWPSQHRLSRTRSSTRSTCRSRPTRSPPRRCCRSTSRASRRSRSTPRARPTRPARSGRCRPARSTASTARSPGRVINAEYGKPVLVRFENHLDENPLNLDRQDFGAPDWSFLTHLHNGHTAPGERRQPALLDARTGRKHQGYAPGQWVDNLYLNWPAGGDDREKQSFFWFHDHRMDHTGSNVYKGMVGLYPIYDPKNGAWTWATSGRACGCPASAPTTRTARSTSTTTSRWRSTTAGSTTASRSTRTSTTRRASSRPPTTRARTPSGGARRSTSTSPTTASSATSSPSTAPPTRCWR